MRLSKQSAPLVDSYDITVSKDELKLIHQALALIIDHPTEPRDGDKVRKFHSVHLDDRKQQIWEEMTTVDKLQQMKGSIDEIKGILD